MKVREMQVEDIDAINALYARSPFTFDWPKWETGEFEQVFVVEDEHGIVGLCGALRTVEIYLLLEGRPETKYEALRELHPAVAATLAEHRVFKSVTFLADGSQRFAERLTEDFGWKREERAAYTLRYGG